MNYIDTKTFGKLSNIALGTAHFGREIPEEIAFEELSLFTQKGGNIIDSAHFYGQEYDDGPSFAEITIGKWLKHNSRDSIVLATKGGFPKIGHKDQSRLDKQSLTNDITASLNHLDTIPDIYFLHRDNLEMEVGYLMETLNSFIDKGWTKHIGASNWSIERIAEANRWAKEHSMVGFTISELHFSLTKTNRNMFNDQTIAIMDKPSQKWYKDNNFPVMAFSPLVKGLFQAAACDKLERIRQDVKDVFLTEENMERINRVKRVATEFNLSATEIMFAYLTSQSSPTIAIAASSNPKHLEESLNTSHVNLSQNILDYLDLTTNTL